MFQVSPVVFQIRDAGRLALTPRPRCLLCEVTVLPTLCVCGGGCTAIWRSPFASAAPRERVWPLQQESPDGKSSSPGPC